MEKVEEQNELLFNPEYKVKNHDMILGMEPRK